MAIIKGTNKDDILDGTPQADFIRGKRGDDLLKGLGGNDTLCGARGADTLDGGAGNDRMFGGKGNDVYYVDSEGDRVIERGREGTDEVRTTLNSYALGPNVENLTFVGTGDFTGKGTALNNIIRGGDGTNTLEGGKGDDTLIASASKLDTAVFAGKNSDYEIVTADGVTTVTDKNLSDGDDGQDTLNGIEQLQFSDKTISLLPPAPIATIELGKLDGTNGFRMYGSTQFEALGAAVSAGDLNNDGFDDLIVTSRGSALAPGSVYVVFGKAAGWDPVFDPTTLDGTTGFRIDLENEGDLLAGSVAGQSDVNGDGIDDLIIGAPNADPNGQGSGSAFVVFGKEIGWEATFDVADLDGENGFRADGAAADSFIGRAVATGGDVNGDGIEDIIVGAVEDRTPNFDEEPDEVGLNGKAFVIFGKDGGWDASFDLSSLDGTNGFVVEGEEATGNTARSVSSAGDVNGDGFDDIFIGAPDANGTLGAGFVVFGKAAGWLPTIDLGSLDGTNGFELVGQQGFDHAGFEVRSAGDVNGDGLDDMIIASRLSPYAEQGDSPAYVIFGKESGWSADLDLGTLNGTDGLQIIAPELVTAPEIAGGGDFNGDGFDDVIVSLSGESFLIYGKGSGWESTFDLSSLDGTNGLRLVHETRSSISVSFAGDVNDDGFDDLIIGAPTTSPDPTISGEGAAYVVFGGNFTGSTLNVAATDGTLNILDVLDVSGGSNHVSGNTPSAGLCPHPAASTMPPLPDPEPASLVT